MRENMEKSMNGKKYLSRNYNKAEHTLRKKKKKK